MKNPQKVGVHRSRSITTTFELISSEEPAEGMYSKDAKYHHKFRILVVREISQDVRERNHRKFGTGTSVKSG